MAMMFDNKRFISEVEARPAIWNTRSEAHADKEMRAQAWNELCLKFIPNFAKKSVQEKNILATQMQRKWKSFRDCFKREYAKQIRELQTESASNRKTYKYYQNLSFLIKVSEPRAEGSPPPQEDGDVTAADKSKRKKRKTSVNTEQEQEMLRSFSQPFTTSQMEVEEADRNFALSLVPHFMQIPYEYKLDAQMEVLMVLKKYKPQGFDYYSQTTTGEQHSAVPGLKISPGVSDDGHPESDDSSINENMYY